MRFIFFWVRTVSNCYDQLSPDLSHSWRSHFQFSESTSMLEASGCMLRNITDLHEWMADAPYRPFNWIKRSAVHWHDNVMERPSRAFVFNPLRFSLYFNEHYLLLWNCVVVKKIIRNITMEYISQSCNHDSLIGRYYTIHFQTVCYIGNTTCMSFHHIGSITIDNCLFSEPLKLNQVIDSKQNDQERTYTYTYT